MPRYVKPRRLGQVNLRVADLARSECCYNECCDPALEFTEPDLIARVLGTDQTPHELGMIENTTGVDRCGRDGILQLPGTIGRDGDCHAYGNQRRESRTRRHRTVIRAMSRVNSIATGV